MRSSLSIVMVLSSLLLAQPASADLRPGGARCLRSDNCASGLCLSKVEYSLWSGPSIRSICESVSCNNQTQDAGEAGIDCGGPCLRGCPNQCTRVDDQTSDPLADLYTTGVTLQLDRNGQVTKRKFDECLAGQSGVRQFFCDIKGNAELFTDNLCQPQYGVPQHCIPIPFYCLQFDNHHNCTQWADGGTCAACTRGACEDTVAGDVTDHLGMVTDRCGTQYQDFCSAGSMIEWSCDANQNALQTVVPNHPFCIADLCDPTATLPDGSSVEETPSGRSVHLCLDRRRTRRIDCNPNGAAPVSSDIACPFGMPCSAGDCRNGVECEESIQDGRRMIRRSYQRDRDGSWYTDNHPRDADACDGSSSTHHYHCDATQRDGYRNDEEYCDRATHCDFLSPAAVACVPNFCEERDGAYGRQVRYSNAEEYTLGWSSALHCDCGDDRFITAHCDNEQPGYLSHTTTPCPSGTVCVRGPTGAACIAGTADDLCYHTPPPPPPPACNPYICETRVANGVRQIRFTNYVDCRLFDWEPSERCGGIGFQAIEHRYCESNGRGGEYPTSTLTYCPELTHCDPATVSCVVTNCNWQGRCTDLEQSNSPTTLGWVEAPDCAMVADHCASSGNDPLPHSVRESICSNNVLDYTTITCPPSAPRCTNGVCVP